VTTAGGPGGEQRPTCLITGGTAGIGLETAKGVAAEGYHVLVVGRDRTRGEDATARIRAAAGHDAVDFLAADLSDQNNVRQLAAAVGERWQHLDVLINNAGGLFGRRQTSAQGIERTFALNHLSYFLLTLLLLPLLQTDEGRMRPARIVNVASRAHAGVSLDFGNLQGELSYNRWQAYKRSKLANLLFTYELARRIDPARVTVNALHPGFVATGIGVRHRFVPGFIWGLACVAAISPQAGAATSIHLATSPDVAGSHGQYFVDRRPAQSSPQSYDLATAERLWQQSERLTGLAAAANG
jgi:NAD(P)-dependent dehydrogenase (short-subunit alcohol dehydrogenase family)